MRTTCAWCLSERGITPQSGTHGICKRHAKQLLKQQQARKEQKAKG